MDSNRRSLRENGERLARKQFRHGPMGLVDRCVRAKLVERNWTEAICAARLGTNDLEGSDCLVV